MVGAWSPEAMLTICCGGFCMRPPRVFVALFPLLLRALASTYSVLTAASLGLPRGVCRAAKLCLVLDLDHTLLNSVMFTEVDAQLGAWLEARAEQHTRLPPEQRMLFRIDEIKVP